ncbi:MAG: hypothetical protein ACK6DZ_22970, partial [Acidobacteriota bacterium]
MTLKNDSWRCLASANRCERVTYVYDEQGGTNWGRLTSMHWNWTVNAQNQTIPCPTGGGFIE